MTPLLPSACSSDRSCASTGSAPVITSSPGNATTKVLPRKACTYGATERSHSTNWAGLSMSRIIIRSDMSAPDPSKKNAARPAPHPAPPSRAVRPAAAAVNARNPLPPITCPEELPVSGRRQEIAEALKKNQVVIVSGETGSGKTTQLPKICLELGRGETGLIGHTQPRRIAASSTDKRIAQELGTPAVEIRYRPIDSEDRSAARPGAAQTASAAQKGREQRDLMDAIADAVDDLSRLSTGDVLVFLPSEREKRDAAETHRKQHPPHVEILPLFARLSAQEQERVFKPSNARRIVLATNVAETSLTVPGIRYVVDTGLARVKRYSYRNKVEQLQIEPVAQSAANQRAGRCGRVAAR